MPPPRLHGSRSGLPPLPPGRRLAAWLVTGPIGHLVAGITDWAVLLGRYGWARARGRDPFGTDAVTPP